MHTSSMRSKKVSSTAPMMGVVSLAAIPSRSQACAVSRVACSTMSMKPRKALGEQPTCLSRRRWTKNSWMVSAPTPRLRLKAIVSGSIFAWRWSFQMQAVNMSDQFSFRGPSTEVEAKHLIRPLGRCSSDPQADQQARNTGCIHLEAHPVDPLAQQMPAAQHTFDPAEKQLHRPPIAIRHGQQLGVQVQPIRDQDQDVWRPILPRLARCDLYHAERLRQQAGMVRRAQAAEDRITHDTRMHGGGRQGALL